MTTLALILGRGGSKGLAGKNSRVIAGRPCVQWSIIDARACRAVDHVAVSTDGGLIAQAATEMGCEVLLREAGDALVSGDGATVDAAARHALGVWERSHARLKDDDAVVLLYANVPVRPQGLIDRALARYHAGGCDSVQSFASVGKHHPWWTVRLDAQTGALSPWEGDALFHGVFRRQDLPRAFVPDGGVMVVSRRALMLEVPGATPGPHQFLGRVRVGVESAATVGGGGAAGGVIDIDDEIDALVAQAVLGRREAALGERAAVLRTHA